MKKISTFLLALVAGVVLFSCNNGDYNTNLNSNANGSINPLNPLKDNEFTWTGDEPFSVDINGSHWVADSVVFGVDTAAGSYLWASKGTQAFFFYLKDSWAGNLYDMGFQNTVRNAWYTDSFGSVSATRYYSSTLGNSGRIRINEFDSAFFAGQFYFQGVNASGQVNNFTKGYFKVTR